MPDRPPPGHGRSTDLAAGVPYAYAALTTDRPLLVFTAGACPLDGAGATTAPRDVVAQAEAAMGNLRVALESAGARLDDVVKITVYVASNDRSDLVAAWRVVHRWFGAHEPPATLLGVSVLGNPTSCSKWRPSRRFLADKKFRQCCRIRSEPFV